LVTPHPDSPGFTDRDAYAHAQDTQLELRVQSALRKGYSAFVKAFDKVKEAFSSADTAGQADTVSWDNFDAGLDQVDDSLARAMLLASLTAVEHVEDQLREDVEFAELAESYLQFDESTLLSAHAVEAILRKIPLTRDEYDQLEARHKSQAFTISRIATADVIEKLKRDMAQHIEDGGTFGEWRDALDEKFDALGVTRPSSHYLEIVYRNNVMRAYNESQLSYVKKNRSRVALLEYHAIRDERTRPAHKAMHGFRASPDSPVWNEWYPPNGHRCRCRVVIISRTVARRYGLVEDPIAPAERPDEGWGYAPDEHLPPQLVERAAEYGIPV